MAPSTDTLWFCELFWHSQGGKVEHEAVLAALSSPKSQVGWPWVRSVRVASKDDREMFACACVMERTPVDFWLLVAKRLMDTHPYPWNKDEKHFLGRTMLQYLLRREADKRSCFVLSLQCMMLLCLGEHYRKLAVQQSLKGRNHIAGTGFPEACLAA